MNREFENKEQTARKRLESPRRGRKPAKGSEGRKLAKGRKPAKGREPANVNGRKSAKGREPAKGRKAEGHEGQEAREGQAACKGQGAREGQEACKGGRNPAKGVKASSRGSELAKGRKPEPGKGMTMIEPCITLRIRRALGPINPRCGRVRRSFRPLGGSGYTKRPFKTRRGLSSQHLGPEESRSELKRGH